MSMPQTVTEPAVHESIVLRPSSEAKGFPAAWLTAVDDDHFIDRAHWNTEATSPERQLYAHYSVNWREFYGIYLLQRKDHNIEISGLVVCHYFGIVGCIIPIGFIPEIAPSALVFTLAGPCDTDGRKDFYLLFYESGVDTATLRRCSPGFSSVADFHLHYISTTPAFVRPVEGGKAEIVALFEKFGIRAKALGGNCEQSACLTVHWKTTGHDDGRQEDATCVRFGQFRSSRVAEAPSWNFGSSQFNVQAGINIANEC
ncbi:hypothetical protein FB451DRAFT_1440774 [Mycena latifolia]|nr:hypothetical protein FB451DRAFT_1440774 [Mycena latifolia]